MTGTPPLLFGPPVDSVLTPEEHGKLLGAMGRAAVDFFIETGKTWPNGCAFGFKIEFLGTAQRTKKDYAIIGAPQPAGKVN